MRSKQEMGSMQTVLGRSKWHMQQKGNVCLPQADMTGTKHTR